MASFTGGLNTKHQRVESFDGERSVGAKRKGSAYGKIVFVDSSGTQVGKAKKNILMCCKFSSYSITASILANKPLLCFKQSLDSNLPRYKAKIQFID